MSIVQSTRKPHVKSHQHLITRFIASRQVLTLSLSAMCSQPNLTVAGSQPIHSPPPEPFCFR